MIKLPLRLRYGDKPLRQAAAWLIPGAGPRIWLDEMLAWGVPLGNAAFYLVPRSAHDLEPQGVLVVLPQGLAPRTTHRSQAYAALVHRTHHAECDKYVAYLPVEARFDPAASDAEVAELAADEGDCILHPTVGRIRLEAGDQRHVVDLLAPPPQRPARWDLADPGQRVNSRLTAVVPAEVPTFEHVLEQGRDDIGSEEPTLDDLPPEPDEPSSGIFSKLGRSLQIRLARTVQKLADGDGAGRPGLRFVGLGLLALFVLLVIVFLGRNLLDNGLSHPPGLGAPGPAVGGTVRGLVRTLRGLVRLAQGLVRPLRGLVLLSSACSPRCSSYSSLPALFCAGPPGRRSVPPGRAGQGAPPASVPASPACSRSWPIGRSRRWPRSTIRSARAAIASCIA